MVQAMRSTTQILKQVRDWRADGHPVGFATVVSTWGSAPRPVGGHMAVCATGTFVGSVSGGCVEAAVVDVARTVMSESAPRVVEYGVSDDDAWAVGLACGGRVRISVVPVGAAGLDDASLAELIRAREALEPVVLASWLGTGKHALLGMDERPDRGTATELSAPTREALLTDRATLLEIDGHEVFLRPHNRPARLIVVGAAHVTQSLVPMASEAGLDVVVVDPRAAFGSVERFPDVRLVRAWPDQALAELGLDHRTAVVTVTHDPKIDDPALLAALRAEPFYIGALGSRRTHASRLERLEAQGVARADLARIRAPGGLDIGARTPQEIALSIVAQVVQELRAGRS
jgi:xanthine dehydrogenase accessory factor